MSNWKNIDQEKPDGKNFIHVRYYKHFRFHPYSKNSQQYKKGIKGRWQSLTSYGGWANLEIPEGSEWSTCDCPND